MSTITLGQYLFERLNQLHVRTIFGVPGDFNLQLLDYIKTVDGLRWAGNANELNAAYAADGYSRVARLGCILTTFGVGELSALNGVAGAYAEHVGLVHVVGMPATSIQNRKLLLHHTLGNGDFTVYHKMSARLSSTTAVLTDASLAAAQIDRVIREAYIHQRPVYLGIPTNLVDVPIPVSALSTPIDLSLPPSHAATLEEVVSTIEGLVAQSTNPVILVDACCVRHGCRHDAQRLVDLTQFPVFTTPMGKGAVDETQPRFGGVYTGDLSAPGVKDHVNGADLILSIGAILSDFNTGAFSYNLSTKNLVEIHSDYTKIRNATFGEVQMKDVMKLLEKRLGAVTKNYVPRPLALEAVADSKSPSPEASTSLTHAFLWKHISQFFREDDIVVTETGTSSFGIVQSHFPTGTLGISQVLWGSIGYTVGATLGALMAAEQSSKPNRRVILFVGDGSLQLTVQELSTMCRWGLKPYLFVLNNKGYTIERLIHGPEESYNDIQPWKHQQLLDTFGAREHENISVSTEQELDRLVKDLSFAVNDKIRLIELHLDVMDAPVSLIEQARKTSETNAE